MNEDYLSPEWLQLRNLILKRDNYTCQRCKKFNPKYGEVFIQDKLGNFEIHKYVRIIENHGSGYNTYYYEYQIDSQFHNKSFRINLGTAMSFPVLQVHHKFYKENYRCWEYDESDLETLCKSCHTDYHQNNPIPVYDLYGKVDLVKYDPIDAIDHDALNFENNLVITNNKNFSEFISKVSVYSFCEERNDAEMKNEGQAMVDFLCKKFFPQYEILYNNIILDPSLTTRYFKLYEVGSLKCYAMHIHLQRFRKCQFTSKILPALKNTDYYFNVFHNRITRNNKKINNYRIRNIVERKDDFITMEVASFKVKHCLL